MRTTKHVLRETAWVLHISASTLICWDKGFDADLKPLVVPDRRGRARKLGIEMVRIIVTQAQAIKAVGKRIRIKGFCSQLAEQGISVSAKKVRQVLIANDLMAPQTRKKRPRFYQSLGQKIPNGLLSIDGSQFTIWLADTAFRFNVELGVDVASFTHTAFSIADTETSDQVIKIVEAHRKKWGCPIGVVCDHGSANLSEEVREYFDRLNIELVPAGPANPKGNGTDEGAFSHLKNALGAVRLKTSSPKELAQSVLHALISVYISMRNRLCLHNSAKTPFEKMGAPVTEQQRQTQRQQLKDHKKTPVNEEDQLKLDRLQWIIDHFGIKPDTASLKRAQTSIKAYEVTAIDETEKAFIRAVRRKKARCNLPYFFGILKNIQQQHDDMTYRQYCYSRYNYQLMLDHQRREKSEKDQIAIDPIISMLERAVDGKTLFVKELALRKARKWTQELMKSYTYIGSLKKKLSDALGGKNHLNLEQKQKAWELIEQFLKPKTVGDGVTLSS